MRLTIATPESTAANPTDNSAVVFSGTCCRTKVRSISSSSAGSTVAIPAVAHATDARAIEARSHARMHSGQIDRITCRRYHHCAARTPHDGSTSR